MRNAADMDDFPLKAIVAINNPFDIWLAINLMRGKLYEKHLIRELRRSVIVRNPINEEDAHNFEAAYKKFDINIASL